MKITRLDRAHFLTYNPYTMKNTKPKFTIKKVRSKANQDVYYTSPQWETKEIEGIVFMPVVKTPSVDLKQTIHWMRKDSMEYVK